MIALTEIVLTLDRNFPLRDGGRKLSQHTVSVTTYSQCFDGAVLVQAAGSRSVQQWIKEMAQATQDEKVCRFKTGDRIRPLLF